MNFYTLIIQLDLPEVFRFTKVHVQCEQLILASYYFCKHYFQLSSWTPFNEDVRNYTDVKL